MHTSTPLEDSNKLTFDHEMSSPFSDPSIVGSIAGIITGLRVIHT